MPGGPRSSFRIDAASGASMSSLRTQTPSHPREGGTLPDGEGAGQGRPAPDCPNAHKRQAAGCRRCCAIPCGPEGREKQTRPPSGSPEWQPAGCRRRWACPVSFCEPQDAASMHKLNAGTAVIRAKAQPRPDYASRAGGPAPASRRTRRRCADLKPDTVTSARRRQACPTSREPGKDARPHSGRSRPSGSAQEGKPISGGG